MVNPTPYGGGAPAVDPYDLLEGGGKRAIKFATKDANGFDQHDPIGTSYTGIITGDIRTSQVTDFDTKLPKFYKDGNPVMQVIMDLQTEYREDADDDGIRALYVKGQMLAAFQAKLKELRAYGRIGEGTRVTVTLVQYKNTGQGNPQKIYQVDIGPEFVAYVPPEQRQVNTALGFAPNAAAQAQTQWASPEQPAFPGQVVPAAAPVQQVPVQQFQQPVAPQAPVQQFPQAIQPQGLPQQVQPQGLPQQAPSPALAALNAVAGQQPVAAPAAPVAGAITQEHVDAYQLLASNGVDPQTALTSLALKLAGGDPAFVSALGAAVGVEVSATA